MSTELLQKRTDVAGLYHQQLQALAFEMRVAMQAIASNTIDVLEASVAKQEMLCHSLLKLSARLQKDCSSPEHIAPFPTDAVEERAASAGRTLHELNIQYSSLLKHSGRSIALLSSLCRSYAGHFPEVRRTTVKRQTWSCEM